MASSDQSAPVLCRKCAVFYGAAKFDNYCSKCYHDLFGSATVRPASTPVSTDSSTTPSIESSAMAISTEPSSGAPLRTSQPIAIAATKNSASSSPLKVSSSLPASTYASSSLMDVDSPEPSPGTSPASFGDAGGFLKKKRNTCAAAGCKKKLGLAAVVCHCGQSFCSDHRYADKHGCTYDYKGAKSEHLAKANPIIAPRKVAEI